MTERIAPTGAQLVRFVPYIYLRSDKADRNVKLRLSVGLNTDDVNQLLEKLPQPFSDTAKQALQFYRRTYLLELADDWRYMTELEISRFLVAEVARENGIADPPDDEVPPLDENEFASGKGNGDESSGA